ncbi:MAG: SCP2 sterol-binding domain-containing protein [Candidatus Helarchaeota archaeon]
MDDLKQKMQIKALFYFMGKGLEIISRTNEEFQEEFEDLDGIFQWTVLGESCYLVAEEGKFDAHLDASHEEPSVTFEVDDFSNALQILKGEVDGTSAYMAGDLNIIGDIQMGMKFGSVAEWLTDMLSDLLS